jgi:hypothetical protein
MAQLLKEGGFTVEALAPMREAVEKALQALLHWRGQPSETPASLALIDSALVQTQLLPGETLSDLARLRDPRLELSELEATNLMIQSGKLFSAAVSLLEAANSGQPKN